MDPWIALAAATASMAAWTACEHFAHQRRLARFGLRIHVNGTRGKSSVTRLIAAGLRAGTRKVFAKTTGTSARMIFPDGRERPIPRCGRPNVIEQVSCVREAVSAGADALVFECMALQPALQELCERKLIRSNVGVITNVRADHLDVMGPTARDVALALAGTLPIRGVAYTAERRFAPLLAQAAAERGSTLEVVLPEEVDESEVAGFGYVEHRENLALALRVCTDLGVDRRAALTSMWRSRPDPGVLTVARWPDARTAVFFMNGFAANDPDSTRRLWNLALAQFPQARYKIALVNCRADRPDRSRQFGEACGCWLQADQVVLMGTGTSLFRQAVPSGALPPERIRDLEGADAACVVQTLLAAGAESAVVVGMGNIAGEGMEVARRFHDGDLSPSSAPEACPLGAWLHSNERSKPEPALRAAGVALKAASKRLVEKTSAELGQE